MRQKRKSSLHVTCAFLTLRSEIEDVSVSTYKVSAPVEDAIDVSDPDRQKDSTSEPERESTPDKTRDTVNDAIHRELEERSGGHPNRCDTERRVTRSIAKTMQPIFQGIGLTDEEIRNRPSSKKKTPSPQVSTADTKRSDGENLTLGSKESADDASESFITDHEDAALLSLHDEPLSVLLDSSNGWD